IPPRPVRPQKTQPPRPPSPRAGSSPRSHPIPRPPTRPPDPSGQIVPPAAISPSPGPHRAGASRTFPVPARPLAAHATRHMAPRPRSHSPRRKPAAPETAPRKPAARKSTARKRTARHPAPEPTPSVDPTSDTALLALPARYASPPDIPVDVARREPASLVRLASACAANLAQVGIDADRIELAARFARVLGRKEKAWQHARTTVGLSATDRKHLAEAEALDAKLVAG